MTPSSWNVAALVPNTGISSGREPNASRLRTSWRPTSRSASAAPLRSNLLMATTSAKSSMSIFSSCDAAPNSGVMTYSDTSAKGTIAASPCPMPGVSTTIRSYLAALQAVIDSPSPSGSSLVPRVARERKKTRSPSRAFIRMRSPSRAPPPRRRVGSTASTATRSASPWSIRILRTSSSVSEDLPEPPVPVMPRTGTWRAEAAFSVRRSSAAGSVPAAAEDNTRASAGRSPSRTRTMSAGSSSHGARSQSSIIDRIMPTRPRR